MGSLNAKKKHVVICTTAFFLLLNLSVLGMTGLSAWISLTTQRSGNLCIYLLTSDKSIVTNLGPLQTLHTDVGAQTLHFMFTTQT